MHSIKTPPQLTCKQLTCWLVVAQDRQQEIVMRDLRGAKALALREKIDSGTPASLPAEHSAVRVTTTSLLLGSISG